MYKKIIPATLAASFLVGTSIPFTTQALSNEEPKIETAINTVSQEVIQDVEVDGQLYTVQEGRDGNIDYSIVTDEFGEVTQVEFNEETKETFVDGELIPEEVVEKMLFGAEAEADLQANPPVDEEELINEAPSTDLQIKNMVSTVTPQPYKVNLLSTHSYNNNYNVTPLASSNSYSLYSTKKGSTKIARFGATAIAGVISVRAGIPWQYAMAVANAAIGVTSDLYYTKYTYGYYDSAKKMAKLKYVVKFYKDSGRKKHIKTVTYYASRRA
ncbi:hypothetical protein [Priestia flexa]|uniref:hypothetical protein n=1 Tax=Priestia flexa TaxID=86664 RepID=UPI0028906580|nr:hypothetical protein [Priestia flexa]MDT2045887.1 hypothetical protein [Priestia flexa]